MCFFADVHSYDEDTMVLDPNLSKHLSHFGINMMNMEKVCYNYFRAQVNPKLSYDHKSFSFRPFPSVRVAHSISSSSKSFCLQHPSPLHQLSSYLLLLHLQIFSLVSLFSSFPVTPFPSSFFPHTLGLSS